jgi:anaerobic selenocysteine-containing dehydrogenase
MVATVEHGRITKLRPDPDHPLSRGYACPKGIAMAEVQNDPDRVTHPLRRAGAGEFERVSWELALGDIAARLRRIPGRSVAWYMGNPGAFSYSHALWVKGFLDALGSPHYYSAGSQDVNNRFAASALLYGSPLLLPIPDLRRTEFLLMVGANPLVSHGSVLSAPACASSSWTSSAWLWSTRAAPRRPASSSTFRSAPTPTRSCCCH